MDRNKPKENHKQRAYLNSLTSVFDQVSKQLIGFFVSPFLVKGLGNSLYGVYQIVLELSGYANMADTQSTQVLKWTLAKNRNLSSNEELRSEVTTGLVIVFLILPLILIVGSIVSWFAPQITNVDIEYYDLVRTASAIVILAIIIDKFTNFFESILRGLNLGFKGLGVRTIIVIVGGFSKILIITLGYGLIGLVILQVFIASFTCLVYYFLVKKNVPWFSLGKTSKSKILYFTKLSGWFMATKVCGMVLFNSEKILLGFLIGPEIVTTYVLTMFTTSAVKGFMDSVISGIVPGIGTFFGKGEFEKIKLSLLLIENLIWWISFSFGMSILLFNQSFLILWIGPGNYAGSMENLLILIISVQYIFFFMSGNFINVTLELKTKVYLTGIAALISIGLSFLLVPDFGILGLCISVILGRLILSFGFPIILKKKIKDNSNLIKIDSLRLAFVSIIGLSLAVYFQNDIIISNWVVLIGSGILLTFISGIFFWFVAINTTNKKIILNQLSNIRIFKMKD